MLLNPVSFICAFALCLLLNFALLPLLKRAKAGQEILQYVTEHASKKGTPTMGGMGFILATAAMALIFCDLTNNSTIVAIVVFVAYGVVGFLDDFIKLRFRRNMGLAAYQKIIVQLLIAVIVAFFVKNEIGIGSHLRVPFSNAQIDLGFWIVPFVVFVYLACTNGVNLTDGIDGLATVTTICFLAGMIVLLKREGALSDSIGDTYACEQIAQMTTLCYVACGSLAAFLLFNCFNAKMFMGDTGSLALGALVACVAIFTRMSLFVPIVGLMFVVSCLSVIVQVVYFKLSRGKRVFLMAPFHHHLQQKGYSETRICVLYGTITVLMIMLICCFGE